MTKSQQYQSFEHLAQLYRGQGRLKEAKRYASLAARMYYTQKPTPAPAGIKAHECSGGRVWAACGSSCTETCKRQECGTTKCMVSSQRSVHTCMI